VPACWELLPWQKLFQENKMRFEPFMLDKQYRDYAWGGEKLCTLHSPTA
jgi:hypothetical protein